MLKVKDWLKKRKQKIVTELANQPENSVNQKLNFWYTAKTIKKNNKPK
ncbi:MAG: hypothetical protein V4580_03095 [Bacteroidota bacterium]